ncbi:BTAD domain-containing putative transcriptional regulator [Actinopolymorpha sp. B9G3]|uniref:AfsR/SARP family transcriptional regulator n=1 Tax=Actinopolymorpha sp. B9G3 TaxID=3158970 RepID=UPI0032D8FEC0
MRIRILGPLEVHDGVEWRRLGAAKWRSLLATLTVNTGHPVSIERLIDELWDDQPPRGAVNQIHGYVMRLRRALGDTDSQLLRTRSPGYELAAQPGDIDLDRFHDLAQQGAMALAEGDSDRAATLLAEALELWRGPAFADVSATTWLQSEVDRLEEERLGVLESRVEADLLRGRHDELVPELRSLLDEHPLRERLWGQLMLALYRAGRQADALHAYQQLYRTLHAELGIEPGKPLRDLQLRILTSDPDLDHVVPVPPSEPERSAGEPPPTPGRSLPLPRQLPADIADFTGRAHALADLDALLAGTSPPGRPSRKRSAVLICAIAGSGGVGKTTLAIHWAHRVAVRFPDGQLYVNLRGYAHGAPLEPADVLPRFLRSLGVDAEAIPVDVEEAAGLYRSLLADKRVLVVLDNATSPEQVRPLLPASPHCAVVVTSRSTLAGLVAVDGAHSLDIGRLPTADAVVLLGHVLGSERTSREPDATADLAELCAGLPLALRVAAANLAANPHREIADLVSELRKDNRLDHLQIDGDLQSAVRTLFDFSYVKLGAQERACFRLLGVVPGGDFTADAVAALLDTTRQEAARLLDHLVDVHLIERRSADRFAFHDLMRHYATERVEQETSEPERDDAVARLLDWYVGQAYACVELLNPLFLRLPETERTAGHPANRSATRTPTHPITGPRNRSGALAWLDAERANLVAAAQLSSERADDRHAWLLSDALRCYFHLGSQHADWLAVARLGSLAAAANGDLHCQVAAQLSLAQVTYHMGNHPVAQAESDRALELSQRAGWTEAEIFALNLLGVSHLQIGQVPPAVDRWERALAMARSLGRDGLTYLGNLAIAYTRTGQLDQAIDRHGQVLALLAGSGADDGPDAGTTYTDLGEVHRLRGNVDLAREHLQRALDIHERNGSRFGVFATSFSLAELDLDLDRPADAARHIAVCARTWRATGDTQMALDLHLLLGDAHLHTGRNTDALREYESAAELTRESGYHYERVMVLIGIAATQARLGRAAEAIHTAEAAACDAEASGYRLHEARARTVLAEAYLSSGQLARARRAAEAALTLHHATGHHLGETRTARLVASIESADEPGSPDGND